jgi:hypothetical protein
MHGNHLLGLSYVVQAVSFSEICSFLSQIWWLDAAIRVNTLASIGWLTSWQHVGVDVYEGESFF